MNKLSREAIDFQNFTDLDEETLKKILRWRNHSDIRTRMKNSEMIAEQEHFRFVKTLNDKPLTHYWLSRRKGKEIGVVNLHIDQEVNSVAEWGFYLSPDYLGSGLGLELGYQAVCIFIENFDLKQLNGFVKPDNQENIRMQEILGFQKNDNLHEGLVHFFLKKENFEHLPKTFKQFRRELINAK